VGRQLLFENLEGRQLLAADLKGFYGPDHGMSSDYKFNIVQDTANWGDTIDVSLYVANVGNASAAAFKVALFVSDNSVIDDGADYKLVCGGQLRRNGLQSV
jgi:hypothetical protein